MPPVKIRGGLDSFPLVIGEWKGNKEDITNDIVIASGAEESFEADYRNGKGNLVNLYIGYRSTPFVENENFFHTPISCFPASGWKVLKRNTYPFKYKTDFPGLKATRMIVEKMGAKAFGLFLVSD